MVLQRHTDTRQDGLPLDDTSGPSSRFRSRKKYSTCGRKRDEEGDKKVTHILSCGDLAITGPALASGVRTIMTTPKFEFIGF